MRSLTAAVLAILAISSASFGSAAEPGGYTAANPFGCIDNASKLGGDLELDDLRGIIDRKVADLQQREQLGPLGPESVCSCLFVAELMKRVGDYRAEDFYRRAIAADPFEPAWDLFLADYYRVFRGAGVRSSWVPNITITKPAENSPCDTARPSGTARQGVEWIADCWPFIRRMVFLCPLCSWATLAAWTP